jgi:hypothetical protein
MDYIKVPKCDARKLFNSGLTVYLIPAFLSSINNKFIAPTPLKKGDKTKHNLILDREDPIPFDDLLEEYVKANCKGMERVHYYVSKDESKNSPFSLIYKKEV